MFNLFKSWPKNTDLSLKLLSYKVAILLLLVTGQRSDYCGPISGGLEIERVETVFDLKTLLKSNRTGYPLSSLHVKDRKLCVVSALRAYISLTRMLRVSQQLTGELHQTTQGYQGRVITVDYSCTKNGRH